jgi:uncharacterized protein (TIGR03437 family)
VYFCAFTRILQTVERVSNDVLDTPIEAMQAPKIMKFFSKFIAIVLTAGMFYAAVPTAKAQSQTLTTVSTTPDGMGFSVDGTNYTHAVNAFWPEGSKHILYATPEADSEYYHTKYTFSGWSWSGGPLVGNPVAVTASSAIKSYQATFQVLYGLNVVFNPCADCAAPGTIMVNGAPITSNQEIYEPQGGSVVLQAYPNSGYIFVGWQSGASQIIQGFQTTVSMAAPATVTAVFAPVQFVSLATIPAGLNLMADRSPVPTPTTMEWGLNTVHTLGVVSPQTDLQGKYWVFGSWSDGGALQHAYTVPGYSGASLTATFVPGVAIQLFTNPSGLNLTVDGRTNWVNYTFVWGTGETHSIQAPTTQTDDKGRIWQFANWSNGGAQSQAMTVPQGADAAGIRMTANFTQLGHLTLTSPISGLALMVNGNSCSVPCDIQQPLGTKLTVSAPASLPNGPGSRQDLAGWSNGAGAGDLVVTLGEDALTITPSYRQMNYLATAAAPTGAASWTLQPASGDGYYDAQTNVAVKVSPLPGFRFRSWTGDLSGATPAGIVAMSAPRNVQAVFDKVPYIMPSGVTNAAGATPSSVVAAGSVVSIFGANLGTEVILGPSSPMAQTLAGTTVRVGDRLLPLFFSSPNQINFQLPADLQPGTQTVTVSTQGQADVAAVFNIVQDAPGLFPSLANGQVFAVAVHADGSAVTQDSPVKPGETITLFGTGFGPTAPARPFGFAVPDGPAYTLTDGVTIQIGSAAALTPSSAYAVAGSVGVDAVQFVLGSDAPSGTNAALTVTINGQTSNTVLLPIQ